MPTQEEYNQAQVELDIANDNYAATQDKINKYNEIFRAFKNASPEAQAKAEATGLMQRALDDYNSLKAQQYVNEDRINVAQNRMNTYREAAAAQYAAAQQAASGGRTKRRVIKEDRQGPEVIVNEDGWTPIYNDKGEIVGWQGPIENLNRPITLQGLDNTVRYTSNFVPNQSMINAQLGKAGTLSQGKGISNMDYVKGALNGLTDTYMNPGEWVYQKNSRQPGYNFGARAGELGTYFTLLGGGGVLSPVAVEAPTYTVANSLRGIYNTPNAWANVNRVGSKYIPTYLNKVANYTAKSIAPIL